MSYPVIKKIMNISFIISLFFLVIACEKNENPYPKAEEQGIDGQKLALAFSNARSIVDLQGLAVARNSIIVAEEYFSDAGSDPDVELHVMSVTKSISSTLIGIAIEEGYIESVNQTLSDFLGEEVDAVNPELGAVTIHQLMTMTVGHDWHELGGDSEFGDFVNAADQLNYIINKPVINIPGTIFNYSDGAAHLASVVISKATGMNASAFANLYLFGPMGLGDRNWYYDNRMFSYGGVGLCIGIHDMISIGQLYLDNGYYNGSQIVPADWVSTVTSFKISTGEVIPFLSDYGYYWWIGNAHNHDFICANGYGGQFIFIVKDLNLIVCTRSNYRGITTTKAGENWYNILNIIINQVLPAVRD